MISNIAKICTTMSWFVLMAMISSVQAQSLTCEDGSCASSPSDLRFETTVSEDASLYASSLARPSGVSYRPIAHGPPSPDPPLSFEECDSSDTQQPSESVGLIGKRPIRGLAKGIRLVVSRPIGFSQRAITNRVRDTRLFQRSRCR